jgi:hypothetical protein
VATTPGRTPKRLVGAKAGGSRELEAGTRHNAASLYSLQLQHSIVTATSQTHEPPSRSYAPGSNEGTARTWQLTRREDVTPEVCGPRGSAPELRPNTE